MIMQLRSKGRGAFLRNGNIGADFEGRAGDKLGSGSISPNERLAFKLGAKA
jgi:hypothetical protein